MVTGIFILPFDIQTLWMQYLCLTKLFKLRKISRAFRDMIDTHLRSYFRSGPQLIAWYTAYDLNRKLLHSFPLSCQKIFKTDYTLYTCTHENTEDVMYDQLYFVFPIQDQTQVVELNVSRVWCIIKLVRMFFPVPCKNFRYQPHKPNGEDTTCPNASEGGHCPAQCFRLGGLQVEFLEDLKLSQTECSSTDHRSIFIFKINEVDIEAQVLSAYPTSSAQVQIIRGPDSPHVPLEIEIDGVQLKLEDYKRILPQNPYLLNWYDRIVIGK